MHHLWRLVVVIIVPILILVVFAVSVTVADHRERVTLCHVAGDEYRKITVSEHAVPAHLRHGDVFADEYGDCPGET